jgi:hypothetical protein
MCPIIECLNLSSTSYHPNLFGLWLTGHLPLIALTKRTYIVRNPLSYILHSVVSSNIVSYPLAKQAPPLITIAPYS